MDDASGGGGKRKSRSRGLRTTTGCLTCRKRHLKCDGRTPECGPCEKSGRSCVYASTNAAVRQGAAATSRISVENPSRSPQRIDAHQAAQWQLAAELTYQSQAIDPGLGSPDLGNSNHARTEAASGLLHLNSGGPYIDSVQDALYPDPSTTESGEGAVNALTPPDAAFSKWFNLLTRDVAVPDGPMTPDFDDTGQNQVLPSLQHISVSSQGQRNPALISQRDIYSVQRSSHVRIRSGISNHIQNQVSQRQPWHGSEPSKLSSHEQRLFEHYVKETSTWIDLFDSLGHFSSFVPHLAMDDAGLMNAILALSARSLLLNPDTHDEQRDPNISIRYYNETLHYLQKAMHYDTFTVSDELLATALIVSTYEMLDEFGTGWERHLQGVFWIQRSQLIQGESQGFKQAVWWAWLRQDVWAAFRERRKTFSYWKPTRTYAEMSADEIALRSIWLFARAVDYCSKEEIKTGGTDLTKRIKDAERILSMLDEWQRSLTVNFRPLPCSENAHDTVFERIWIHQPAYAVSIQLHHSAQILLLLESPSQGGMQGFIKQQRRLEKSVETICGIAMALTDKASGIMSAQCLFVAGLCTQDSRKRAAILELIDQCQVRTGWPTKSLSEELRVEWEKLDAR